MSRILVVDDEPKIAAVLCEYLAGAGHQVHSLGRGDAVLPWLAEHQVDLIVLDLNLPGQDGLSICQALRARGHGAAVIMATARVEEIERIQGLEVGADDYLCKPYSPRELVARVKAVLRRGGPRPADGLAPQAADAAEAASPGLRIDPDRACALVDGVPVALTALELRLLSTLAAQPGRIFNRDALIDAMYPDARVVADRTVDSHVKKLRQKLQQARPDGEFVRAVYGLGYRFEPGG